MFSHLREKHFNENNTELNSKKKYREVANHSWLSLALTLDGLLYNEYNAKLSEISLCK